MSTHEGLQQKFEKFWADIRGSRLYAGQPRNAQSTAGVALAREALRLATDAADPDLLLEARRMMYYSLTADEQYNEAIPYCEQAIAQCEERGDFAQATRVRIGEVAALSHAGRYDEALKVAEVAEQWLQEQHDEVGYARLCTNVAILYFRLDQHKLSIDHYVQAARIFEVAGDRQAAAQVYLNHANTLSWFDRFEESDAMYERVEQISKELALDELWIQARYNRSYLLYLRGRYSESLQGFSRLREHFKQTGSVRHSALCDLDEIEIYLQLSLSKDAATLARRAAEQFQQISMFYEEAKAQAFHGVALMQMRKYGEALEMFRLSQQGFEGEGNQYWVAALDLHRADVHLALGRYWEAQALAAQAKQRFETLGFPSRRMLSLVLLGRIALALKDVQSAEKHTAEIASITAETRAPLLLFPYHMLCGQIAEMKKSSADAEAAYRAAAEDLEQNQARLQHDDLKVTFLHGRNQVYEALVRLSLLDEDSLRTAYSWCERAKSRGLVELLSQHMLSVQARGEQSLLQRIHTLREELNVHYIRGKPESRSTASSPDFETMAIKEQELARTLREVGSQASEYVSLQQVRVAELEQVQQFVPEHTTLIEYFITREEVMAFVVSRNSAKVVRRLSPPNRIHTTQEKLTFQLEKFLLGEEFVQVHSTQILEATLHYLKTLYSALMERVLPEITTPSITIVPHGALHSLPFHALFDGDRHLLDHFEISYAPSASVLRYCVEKPDIADASPLLVGVPDESAPMVDEEVSALSSLFHGARVLRGEEATRDAFARAARYSTFVHVATHATFRQDNPMFSNFKLADGYVTALDLFSMNCETNLVILSGCKSGLGQVGGSDDLLGLMRGFLYAGARSLLLSLWSVNDASTVELMKAFYKEWINGATKAQALRRAMQTVRDAYPNPFYWAPFLLVGKV
jgi:CHAT domain-containing protein/tetratricopeptide (TPR) repeat protein